MNPSFTLIIGPMWSGKTSRLLTEIERTRLRGKPAIVFKPKIDDRYAQDRIQTHDGWSIDAIPIGESSKILEHIKETKHDVIAVDEAFMISEISDILVSLFKQGKSIIVSSIDMSSSGKGFREITSMLPWATRILKLSAICSECDQDAYFTRRKSHDVGDIVIGGSDMYEPRCYQHFDFADFDEVKNE